MNKKWLDEFARDLIAVGSIPLLILTIARVSVMRIYYPMQFIIGSFLFFILKFVFRGNLHAGIGFILLSFTSLYYRSVLFLIFAFFIYVSLILALFYLKRDEREIVKGILFGGISAGMSYLITRSVFF